uniref:Ig-like domain-containing protein n=1 Tax=Panagrellus redivivus TaxID=6233 RepID=A0A7E4VWN6_PANRE
MTTTFVKCKCMCGIFLAFAFIFLQISYNDASLPPAGFSTPHLSDIVTYFYNGTIWTFAMAQSDAIAAELVSYQIFNATYRCRKCVPQNTIKANFTVRFTLTDRCPYPGVIDDAHWSIGPSSNLFQDRTIDKNALNFFTKAFPGFARDFIESEDPDIMREHFWQVLGADIFTIEKEKKKHPEERIHWETFDFAEERILGNKHRIFNVEYSALDGPVFQVFDTAKMETIITNMAKHERVPRAAVKLSIEKISNGTHYPLHQETAQAIALNNVFVKFIETLDAKEPNVPSPLPPNQDKTSTSKAYYPQTFENLQRESLSNPQWRRTETSEVYFSLPGDTFWTNESSFSSKWIKVSPELRLRPEMLEISDEVTMTCDLNHFQFKLTPHFHEVKRMKKGDNFVRKVHDAAQEFIYLRFLSLLWPTALNVMFGTSNCVYECPGSGKMYISAGCVSGTNIIFAKK